MTALTLAALADGLASRKYSAVELAREALRRAEAAQPALNAMVTMTGEQALAAAAVADKRRAAGEAGPLTGVPMIHKDIFCTEGVLTTCASRMLSNFVAPYDATVVRRLKDAGMVMIKEQAALIAQLQQSQETATNESRQAAQAAALNENRTRQFVEELEERLDDAIRPVRSLQSHVTDLLEQNRRKVDDSTQNKERFGEISANIEHLSAQTDRSSAIAHGLRDGIDAIRGEVDELRRDILRTDDATKIVDQDSRRRVQGVSDMMDGFNARLDEIRADIAHTAETIDDTRRSLVHIDPSLDELRTAEQALRADLTTMQGTSDERYDQLVDMIEEQRQETDARFDQLRHTLEERIERLNERLEESNDSIRETGYKISEINSQLEELKQQDAALHRDIWYLHEQRVRVRLEQVQEELDLATAQRRDAEGEARVGLGTRIRRRRSDGGSGEGS